MSDQGLWFKLWCSAADDPDLDNLDMADFGRWCKFGAFVKRHGTTGAIELRPPSRGLCASLQVPNFDALAACFTRFPHVTMRRDNSPVSDETTLTVSFTNWAKYQGDFRGDRASGFVKVGGAFVSRAEHAFARLLDELGLKYQRHARFPFQRTFYTVDFHLPDHHLAFEIQGPEHATRKYRLLDRRKARFLNDCFGILVIPLDNTSIEQNTDFTRSYVNECIESRSKATSPLLVEEKRREETRREEKRTPPLSPPQSVSLFQLRGPLLEALEKAPVLGRLRNTAWWQAEVRANPGVNFAAEVLKAEAWMKANPSRAPKRDFPRFLHTWLARADRETEDGN